MSQMENPSNKILVSYLLCLVFILALFRFFLIHKANINWDEFATLNRVYLYNNGELSGSIQNFMVAIFQWLPLLGGIELDQIIGGRFLIYGVGIVALFAFYFIMRQISSPGAAVLAILFFLGFSYSMEHGNSLRHDTVATSLSLIAFFVYFKLRNAFGLILSVIIYSLAILITVKSLIFTCLFIALNYFYYRSSIRAELKRIATFIFLVFIAYGFFISLYMGINTQASLDAATEKTSSVLYFISQHDWHIVKIYLLPSLRDDAVIWTLVALALITSFFRLFFNPRSIPESAMVLLLAAPLLSLVYYRNMFPYFYIMLLPSMCAIASLFVFELVKKLPHLVSILFVGVIASSAFLSGLKQYFQHNHDEQESQRIILSAIHEMFNEPVGYIDRCGMVASFRGSGIFMSTASMDMYQAKGEPVLYYSLANKQPKFVLANHPALSQALNSANQNYRMSYRLLEADAKALRKNYIHHWGPIYIAGKSFKLPADEPVSFDLLVEGQYTIETSAPVTINDITLSNGDTIELVAGPHRARGSVSGQKLMLRWGDNILVPEVKIRKPIFFGF